MDFQQTWRQQIQERLARFADSARAEFQQAAPNLLYGFLSAMALWPVAQAVQGGELAALVALGSVAGGVGANLIANQVQSWKDEADAAEQLSQAARDDPNVREALDALLDKLGVVEQAQAGMSDQDRTWFLETLRREVARLGNLERYQAVLIGIHGPAAVGDRSRAVQTETYIERQEVHPSPVQAQKEEALIRYLRNLRRLCNALPLAALAEEEGPHHRAAITLNRVYIALNTTDYVSRTEEERLARQSEREIPRLSDILRPLPALEAADQGARLVILGDPGSGKSTFVNYLAYLLAGAWLGEEEIPEGWSHDALLPLRVVLRELVGYLPETGELQQLSVEKRMGWLVSTIWEYLCQDLEATYRAGEALEILEREVDRGRALVIFDGLDEVAPERRGVVREAVEAFCHQCHEKSRVLVTCRIRSYQGEARLSAFADVTLASFRTGQIDDFVGRWYQALADLGALKSQEAKQRAENLWAAVRPLMELARNPLLLTTMAVVHTAQIELPRERARLYQRCVDVLLRRWHKHKVGEVPLLNQLGVSESELLVALWEVAYQAHQGAGAKEEGDLPRSEVLRVLAGHLEGKYGPAEQFLDYVDTRAGLLVGQGGIREPVYAFPHRTFQEYLAGCHLALGGRDFGRRLRGLLEEGALWALAAQLGAEHLLYNVGDVTKVLDAAYTLCPIAEPEGEADWRGVLWAGLFAAEVGRRRIEEDTESPDGGAAFLERLVSRLVKILEEERLGPIERAAAGDALARLGDPRPGVGLRSDGLPDVVWCEVPGGPFVMGTQEQDILALLEKYGVRREWYERETPQHKPNLPAYSISKYPVTNAQYAAFVQDGGYAEKWHKCWTEAGWEWKGDRTGPRAYGGVFDLPNHPVVGVTWYEAVAFCRWLTERLREAGELGLSQEVALPTEAQWEKAARGEDGRIFPWGNEFDPARCNVDETGLGTTSAVGVFPAGASPYRVLDTAGNVWEWTRSLWGEDVGRPLFKYPYDPADGREDLDAPDSVLRVLRGGSWLNRQDDARCVERFRGYPNYSDYDFGFRLVSPVGSGC